MNEKFNFGGTSEVKNSVFGIYCVVVVVVASLLTFPERNFQGFLEILE